MHYWFVKEHQNSKSGRGIDWSSRSREVGGEGDKKNEVLEREEKDLEGEHSFDLHKKYKMISCVSKRVRKFI